MLILAAKKPATMFVFVFLFGDLAKFSKPKPRLGARKLWSRETGSCEAFYKTGACTGDRSLGKCAHAHFCTLGKSQTDAVSVTVRAIGRSI